MHRCSPLQTCHPEPALCHLIDTWSSDRFRPWPRNRMETPRMFTREYRNREASQASICSLGCRKFPGSNSVGFSLSVVFLSLRPDCWVSAWILYRLLMLICLCGPLDFPSGVLLGAARHSPWLLSLLLIFVFSEVESIPPGPVLKPSLKDAGRLRYKFRKRPWQSALMRHVFENIPVSANESVNSAHKKNAFQIVLL